MWKLICYKCGASIKFDPSRVHNKLFCSCGVVLVEYVGGSAPRVPEATTFADLWREIHTLKLTNPETDMATLKAITARLPCGDCQRNWPKVLKNDPPPLDDQEQYFEWTWRTHRVHGGDDITLEDAKDIWGVP